MSILTEVLKLFCYDPETDGANTFNIPKALNENWEKIDQLVLLAVAAAAAYDPEGSYAVGDYCTHGGKLHKCGTPIESGEVWNAAHWTETTVAAELAAVKTELSNKLGLINGTYADLSAMPNQPITYLTPASGVVGLPDEWPQSRHDFVRLWCGNLSYTLDFIASYANKKLAYRMGQTQKWQVLVTKTPPESLNIPLEGGFTGTLRAERNQFGQVLLTGAVAAESINANDLIATLPDGFLPKASEENFSAVSNRGADGNSFATLGQISSDGNVNLWRAIPNNYAANTYLVINHNYQART